MPEAIARAAATPASKKAKILGWVLTAAPAALLIFSGVMKLMKPADMKPEFERLGYSFDLARPIGGVELACVLLYLIPRTSVLGAVLLAGYMGGAIATHVRLGEAWYLQAAVGVVAWLGLFLREPRLRTLIPLRSAA